MLRPLLIAAFALYTLSLLGVVFVTDHPHRQPLYSPTTDQRAQRSAVPLPLRGFAISLHHTDQFPLYLQAVDEIAALGFDSLEVATPAFQTDGASQQIRIETGPGRGPQRGQLVTLLKHAKTRGLTTSLMPQVLFTQPRGNEWRGKIHPHNWAPWWESYREMIGYFLDVAIEADVDIFCVGSELLSTERQTDRWVELIAEVRQGFRGLLTYSTNWDHYHVPTLWRHLDLIGISGYWDMTKGVTHDPPTPEDLAARWSQIRTKLLNFAIAQNRPILFTEIGYPTLPWAIKDPWNYVNSDNTLPDPHAQAAGYAAFLAAWEDLLIHQPNPAVAAGVFFFEWDPYHQGGPGDSGYGVRGKPAFDLLRQWLVKRP